MTRVAVLLATACGVGYTPVAPGTAGSAVGVLLFLVVRDWPFWAVTILGAAIITGGIWAGGRAAAHFGREDPGPVVIDEVAGQLVTCAAAGASGGAGALVAGFLLFRAFDIFKPWPVRRLESLPGGLGIMADDLMAGVYGYVTLLALVSVVPRLL